MYGYILQFRASGFRVSEKRVTSKEDSVLHRFREERGLETQEAGQGKGRHHLHALHCRVESHLVAA